MSGAAQLLGAKPVLALLDLLSFWAPEIGVDIELLGNTVMEAASRGELDTAIRADGKEAPGLFMVQEGGGRFWSTNASALNDLINGHPSVHVMGWLVISQQLAVGKEAILAFCERHRIEPPSFWAISSNTTSTKRRGSGGRPAFLREQVQQWFNALSPPVSDEVSDSLLAASFAADHPALKEHEESVRKTLPLIRGRVSSRNIPGKK